MNILHVAPYYAPAWTYGGVVRAVHGLASAQAALGHTVTVLTTDTLSPQARLNIPRETIDGATVIRCRNWLGVLRQVNLSSPVGLVNALRALPSPPDIIHCHELRTVENLILTTTNRRQKIPMIVSPHGTLPQDTGRSAVKRGWDRLFGKQLAAGFAGVVALTDAEAAAARQWWSAHGVPDLTVAVIPNGVDLPDLYQTGGSLSLLNETTSPVFAARDPLPGRYARQDKTPGLMVLFMGRLHERKGVQFLIPAFAQANVPNSRLLIVGPDEGMAAPLHQLAITCGVADRVVFAGYLSGALREQAFASADLFALPAVGEGLSMAVLEAMAAGLPVILTPGCNFPEAETEGAGLIVDREVSALAKAIGALLTNDAQREAMGAAGRQWMEKSFSWPTVATQMIGHYQRFLSGP